jgi:hypothetical protein
MMFNLNILHKAQILLTNILVASAILFFATPAFCDDEDFEDHCLPEVKGEVWSYSQRYVDDLNKLYSSKAILDAQNQNIASINSSSQASLTSSLSLGNFLAIVPEYHRCNNKRKWVGQCNDLAIVIKMTLPGILAESSLLKSLSPDMLNDARKIINEYDNNIKNNYPELSIEHIQMAETHAQEAAKNGNFRPANILAEKLDKAASNLSNKCHISRSRLQFVSGGLYFITKNYKQSRASIREYAKEIPYMPNTNELTIAQLYRDEINMWLSTENTIYAAEILSVALEHKEIKNNKENIAYFKKEYADLLTSSGNATLANNEEDIKAATPELMVQAIIAEINNKNEPMPPLIQMVAYGQIAYIYVTNQDFDQAIKAYNDGIKVSQDVDKEYSQIGIYFLYSGLSNAYLEKKDYSSSFINANFALDTIMATKDSKTEVPDLAYYAFGLRGMAGLGLNKTDTVFDDLHLYFKLKTFGIGKIFGDLYKIPEIGIKVAADAIIQNADSAQRREIAINDIKQILKHSDCKVGFKTNSRLSPYCYYDEKEFALMKYIAQLAATGAGAGAKDAFVFSGAAQTLLLEKNLNTFAWDVESRKIIANNLDLFDAKITSAWNLLLEKTH